MTASKEANSFKRKFHIKDVNSTTLYDALTEQGYTIVEFNGVCDSEEVTDLIEALHLEDQVAHSKCFTFQNDKYRLIFLHEDLNEEERTIVLAHEAGHIWNGHMAHNSVFGEDVIQEQEANEFSHYLLRNRSGIQKRKKAIATVLAMALIMTLGLGIILKTHHDAEVYTEHFYRTAAGSKYHVRNCMFLKDKKGVYRLTKKEFESGEYEPCGACLPNEKLETK